MRWAILIVCLSGCHGGVPERPANDVEMRAVELLRAEYAPGVGCGPLDPGRVFVWTAPQRVIADYCSGGRSESGTIACVTGSYGAGPFVASTRANISWDSGWNVHHRLILHEAAHALSACLGRGTDRSHAHRDLWDDGVRAAADRFFAEHPIPADPADDPYTRLQRHPWDLTGTHYQGRDCEVQPLAWIAAGEVPGCSPPPADAGD